MPEVSRFFGIRIVFYFDEHPPAHFHAIYEGRKATFEIETLQMIAGSIRPRARGLVVEWAAVHQQELLDNWNRLRAGQNPAKIAPLE